MAAILLITSSDDASAGQLELLNHHLVRVGMDPAALSNAPRHDLTVLDCRAGLLQAKAVARILQAAGWQTPLILFLDEASVAAVSSDWGLSDFILTSASLSEVEARLRLALDSKQVTVVQNNTGLAIDDVSYTAKINGRTLDLTFKEFELLKHLNDNPGRVFSREQLLSEVWGYDYFGGTRTVDVHVRRLRAKLGEAESIIGTVRNVGYRLNPDGLAEE